MSGKKSSGRRKLGEFHVVSDPTQRNNPQSLRKTLYDITQREYGENLLCFAERLKYALRTRMNRSLHSLISAEVINNVLFDRTHVKYYHLEAYARYLQIPVSLMLLFSRAKSNQDDDPFRLNDLMFRAFSRVIKDAQSKLEAHPTEANLFDIDDFFRWVKIFKEEENETAQLQLFPDATLVEEG